MPGFHAYTKMKGKGTRPGKKVPFGQARAPGKKVPPAKRALMQGRR